MGFVEVGRKKVVNLATPHNKILDLLKRLRIVAHYVRRDDEVVLRLGLSKQPMQRKRLDAEI